MTERKGFDFRRPSDVYCQRQSGRTGIVFRRFATGAAAVRYAIETMSAKDLLGCTMEQEGERYGAKELQELYARSDYPLKRKDARRRAD